MRAGKRHTVLVIDDNDIDRASLTEILTIGGYVVHGMPSPIGATKAARQLNVDAVIIDQNLPAMDGNKLASLFRGSPALRELCVVLISGNDNDVAMRELAKQAQIDGFVSKRTVASDLVPLLRKLLVNKA